MSIYLLVWIVKMVEKDSRRLKMYIYLKYFDCFCIKISPEWLNCWVIPKDMPIILFLNPPASPAVHFICTKTYILLQGD